MASKVATLKGASLGFFFHETFNDFNDATDVIKEQQLDYLNLKMKVQKSGNKPKQFMIESLQEGAKPVELRYASSGIQTSAHWLPLSAILQKNSHSRIFKRSVAWTICTNKTDLKNSLPKSTKAIWRSMCISI